MSALKALWLRAFAVLLGLVITTGLLELIVFRLLLTAPDLPRMQFNDGIIHYAPNQHGVHRVGDDVRAEFRINESGWNSPHQRYADARRGNRVRIAVIGDSFVHASQVDYNRSLGDILERELGSSLVEVYRFGVDGAPLSQYLAVMRMVVARYDPDVVVIVVVHNDFTESYRFQPGTYTSSFLKLKIHESGDVEEVPPDGYERRWYDPIREGSAMWRYFAYRRGLRFEWLRRLVLGEEEESPVAGGESGERERSDSIAAAYVMKSAAELAESTGTELLVLMDGDRRSIEMGESERDRRNYLMARITRAYGVRFVDLHETFLRHFSRTGESLSFETDEHWNERGHRLAAEVVISAMADSAYSAGQGRTAGGAPQ